LEPSVAAALVINAKQAQVQAQAQAVQPVHAAQPPAPQSYGQPYGNPSIATPSYAPAPPQSNQYPSAPASNPANLSSLISSLDPSGLQQLLGAMSQNNQVQTPQPPTAAQQPDLAHFLGSVTNPQIQQSSYAAQTQQNPIQGYPIAYQQMPALASFLNGQPSAQHGPPAAPLQSPTQATPTGQPNMKEIMEQLARYQR
jgi:hypothetical protein